MGRKIAKPFDISAEQYAKGYVGKYTDPEQRKLYLKGWEISQRDDASLDDTDDSEAKYEGYMDYAVDLGRGHAMFCEDCICSG